MVKQSNPDDESHITLQNAGNNSPKNRVKSDKNRIFNKHELIA